MDKFYTFKLTSRGGIKTPFKRQLNDFSVLRERRILKAIALLQVEEYQKKISSCKRGVNWSLCHHCWNRYAHFGKYSWDLFTEEEIRIIQGKIIKYTGFRNSGKCVLDYFFLPGNCITFFGKDSFEDSSVPVQDYVYICYEYVENSIIETSGNYFELIDCVGLYWTGNYRVPFLYNLIINKSLLRLKGERVINSIKITGLVMEDSRLAALSRAMGVNIADYITVTPPWFASLLNENNSNSIHIMDLDTFTGYGIAPKEA